MKNTEKKKQLIEKRGHRCECCGLTEWLNQPIKLEVHHIDGDNTNNQDDNLQLLCPNCHSYTPNHSKNIYNHALSDEEFVEILQSSETIHQALLKANLSTAGSNYARARRLIQQYQLEHLYQHNQPINYCVDCGAPIGTEAVRCSACDHKRQRKADRPTKDELYQLLMKNTFVAVGKMYGVSDNAVRKWCKSYDIPYRAADYKRQQSNGKSV